MITFVEYDENGELFHIAEIHTTEGRDVEPLPPGLDPAERAAYAKRLADAIAQREKDTRAQLQAHADGGARLLVLAPNANRPSADTHKVDGGKLRAMTAAERNARAAAIAAAAQAAANRPAPPP